MHSVKNSRNQNHARSPKGHKTPPSTRIFLKKPMEIKSKMLAIRKLGVFGLALNTLNAETQESVFQPQTPSDPIGSHLLKELPAFFEMPSVDASAHLEKSVAVPGVL